jgi:hypothetical protein
LRKYIGYSNKYVYRYLKDDCLTTMGRTGNQALTMAAALAAKLCDFIEPVE